jgi:putative transcriptional regulator
MISHHSNDALLLDYASGGASQSISLLVATHLALCPTAGKKSPSSKRSAAR